MVTRIQVQSNHMNKVFLLIFLLGGFGLTAQNTTYWQQHATYDMDIDFDVETDRFTGTQQLVYTNNSPDTLRRAFWHLYLNAFQPGSMMDLRNQNLPDSDPRVGERIKNLKPNEIGFTRVESLTQNGKPVDYERAETILEVTLNEPIPPGGKATFDMVFESQVPVQIRRNGRDSKEGIEYSMSQWYPKMCEYDYMGWHANPYIGREFYGIWGDFDVKITIDSRYVIGGTGYLQNPEQIGHGYTDKAVRHAPGSKITYHFVAPNVHDFFWGADPDYKHVVRKLDEDTDIHYFYQDNEDYADAWEQLPAIMEEAFQYIQEHYGEYPYEQYSFVQGGDGGMEYPMGTLITGDRALPSLVGVSVHELMHTWYQMLMGTNEALYAWMDEGFTSWSTSEVMNHLRTEGALAGGANNRTHAGSYRFYQQINEAGYEEPLTVHADHFRTNAAYGMAAYAKGAVFLERLRYVIGEENLDKTLLRYYDEWRFKHPHPNDFIRVAEKVSGLELDWYKEYMVNTTATVDYGITNVREGDGKSTRVELQRIGDFPLPQDVLVTYKDGSTELFNIPLVLMRGNKPADRDMATHTVLPDWPWTHPTYEFTIPKKMKKIDRIQLDPKDRAGDFDSGNNGWSRTGDEPED